VVKFQKLFEYANGPHGSQLHLDINTQIMAKHYRDARNLLRNVKAYLNQDADYIRRNLDAASEESDYTRSRASSIDSQFSRPVYKVPIPCSALSSQELQESSMKETSTSASSADETDEEHLVWDYTLCSACHKVLLLPTRHLSCIYSCPNIPAKHVHTDAHKFFVPNIYMHALTHVNSLYRFCRSQYLFSIGARSRTSNVSV